MWANAAIMCSAAIAIVAQKLIVVFRPTKFADDIQGRPDGFAMQAAAAIYVIDRQKSWIGFAATCAFAAVCRDHLRSYLLSTLTRIPKAIICVFEIVFSSFGAGRLTCLWRAFVLPPTLSFGEHAGVGLPLGLASFVLKMFALLVSSMKTLSLFFRNFRWPRLALAFLAYVYQAVAIPGTAIKELIGCWVSLAATVAIFRFSHARNLGNFCVFASVSAK